MNKKKPQKPEKVEKLENVETEPNIQMTPVEFSPVQSENELGSVGGIHSDTGHAVPCGNSRGDHAADADLFDGQGHFRI
jgi:hypothetical protein